MSGISHGLTEEWAVASPRATPQSSVTVVLPCLNEAASVGACVTEARAALAHLTADSEVLVVDNGSTDGSPGIAAAAGARVIVERKRGYGAALRSGVRAARGDIVVMADADCTYDLRSLSRLVHPIADGTADLVIGSRLHDATRRTMPLLHRWVGTPALTFLVQRASGESSVSDSQSGYRAFRRSTMLALGLRASGMEYASEMLIRATQAGLRMCDVPTGYRERVGDSKLNTVSDGWRHLRLILSVAPHLLLLALGTAGLLCGAALLALQFHEPRGIVIGSTMWQPLFLAGILMLLGEQALLIALVLSRNRARAAGSTSKRFIHGDRLPSFCAVAGALIFAGGLALDGALLVAWIHNAPNLPRFALAALARIAIVGGGSLATFGVLLRLAHEQVADSDLDARPYTGDDPVGVVSVVTTVAASAVTSLAGGTPSNDGGFGWS